jgi:hypothetical protein
VQRVGRLDDLARAAIHTQADAAAAAAALPDGAPPAQRLSLERRATQVPYLTIYRTTADPAMLDLSIDPDDRTAGGHDGYPRPDLQNWSGTGFARYLTPRAWLSTWSGLSSHADTTRSLAHVTAPTLVVHYAGDVYTCGMPGPSSRRPRLPTKATWSCATPTTTASRSAAAQSASTGCPKGQMPS